MEQYYIQLNFQFSITGLRVFLYRFGLVPLACKKIQIGAKGFVDLKPEYILVWSGSGVHGF